jgi:hypothetical protein
MFPESMTYSLPGIEDAQSDATTDSDPRLQVSYIQVLLTQFSVQLFILLP